MLEAKNLKKLYQMKKGVTVRALDDVSLKLGDTGMVFILGKSGSGKSTLLNVLGGLDSIDEGEIIIKGTSAKEFKQSHYDSYRNTYIGFIFQEYNILDDMTVGANVALAIELQGRRATSEEVNSILKEVDLDGYGHRKPNELSGGQKQRVAIARALVKSPEIIMADEPTGALDSETGKQVFDTLKKLSEKKLVLIVSHDREFSEQYADRIIELKDGKIISDVEKIPEAVAKTEKDDTEENLVFSDNEITVKQGYTITEEDRALINEYILSLNSDAKIKFKGKKKGGFTSNDFKDTDESKIILKKDENFKLIKSRLSMKNAFKIGSGGLKYKKVRLVFTVFLSFIAFTLFGLADTIAAYNNISTATQSIYDTGVNYASFVKEIKEGNENWTYWNSNNNYFTLAEMQSIKEGVGYDVIGIYKSDESLDFMNNLGKTAPEGMVPSVIFSSKFSGLAAIDNETITKYGFTLHGNLPEENKAQIVITKYTYDYFATVGYMALTDKGAEEIKITKYDDLIGKTLQLGVAYNGTAEYEIVGILDTSFDYTRYLPLADENAEFTLSMIENMALTKELTSAKDYSFASIGFISSSMMEGLVSAKISGAESLSNHGSLSLYIVNDDNFDSKKGIWGENGENVISQNYYAYLNSLEKIKDHVIWLNQPLTELKDNQVLISVSEISNFFRISAEGGAPEVWYNDALLTDIERQICDNAPNYGINFINMREILTNPTYSAAVVYAVKNPDSVKALLKNHYMVNENFSEEDADNNILNQGEYFVGNFANYVGAGFFSDVITKEVVQSYIQDVITRYSLESYKISDALRQKLMTNEAIPDNYFMFGFQIREDMNRSLAVSYAGKYYADALSYYKTQFSDPEHIPSDESIDKFSAISNYADYLVSYTVKTVEGFTPTAEESFDDFKANFYVDMARLNPNTQKLVTEYYKYGNPTEYIKNIEIVGFVKDSAKDTFDMWSPRLVVSDGIISSILGANLGGIYRYALGAMPTELTDIRKTVSFAKTHTAYEGNVRYKLANNVTEQLSMVDEILEVLGQVFMYVGLGFAVFASVMLANFISTSISHKKQDIGILRAIGSRSSDVFRIFFAEAFIIAMINYVLATAGTFAVTIVINSVLRNEAGLLITFLNFGIRQIGILLAISLAVAFVATFLPVKKIASLKPIDAIKNRK